MNSRVLALVSDGFGASGGIAAYNRELLSALGAAAGTAPVRVLALNADDAAVLPPGVRQEPGYAGRARFAAAALARGARRPYDWVFCGHINLVGLARAVATLAGARLWLQVHGIEAWRAPRPSLRSASAHAALVTAVSRITRQRFLGWAPVHPHRVRVLSNTFDPAFALARSDDGLRQALAPAGEPVLLTVARLASTERYKGHEQVMQALVLLGRELPVPPVYVIAGQGDDRDRLERRARELGVVERVRFVGALDTARLAALYRTADVFVMPSTGEGFGIVFLEAAASGVPVVAGDADGARDALRDGRVGRLVNARDPRAIADAIRATLQRPAAPGGFEVFSRQHFRAHLAAVLESSTSGPAMHERWL